MTLTTSRTDRSHRPGPVRASIGLLCALGVSAVGGGAAMVFGIGGDDVMPDEYLEALPLVTNWVVPGLVLMIGFGIGSLVTAYGVVRRPSWRLLTGLERLTGYHWSWTATLLIGIGHVVWIMLEVVSIPFSILMPIYGAIGLALAVLPLTRAVRADLHI